MRLEDTEKRVAIYARVSTASEEQANSIDNQIEYYRQMIAENPKWTLAGIYADRGISGKSADNRPEFQRMIQDGEAGKFNLIITKELSRFSRSLVDTASYTDRLLSSGVAVFFETQNLNTSEPSQQLTMQLLSVLAEQERKTLTTRIKFGFEQAIKNGVVLGNNRIWGYRKKDGRLVIEPTEARIVKRIFELYVNENLGILKVCDRLNSGLDEELKDLGPLRNKDGNPFTFNTVRGILVNPKYKGFYSGGKTQRYERVLGEDEKKALLEKGIVPPVKVPAVRYLDEKDWTMYKDENAQNEEKAIVPAIVEETLWDQANRRLMDWRSKRQSGDPTRYQSRYPYSGKIICGEHRIRYQHTIFRYKSGNKEAWQCKRYYEHGKDPELGCDNPIVYSYELDEVIKTAVEVVVKNRSRLTDELMELYTKAEPIRNSGAETEKIEKEIQKVQHRSDLLQDEYYDRSAEEKARTKAEYLRKRDNYEKQLFGLQNRMQELKELEQVVKEQKVNLKMLRDFIDKAFDFEGDLPGAIVNNVLDRIEVYKGDTPKTVKLKVYFRIYGDEGAEFLLRRKKGEVTSVIAQPYI